MAQVTHLGHRCVLQGLGVIRPLLFDADNENGGRLGHGLWLDKDSGAILSAMGGQFGYGTIPLGRVRTRRLRGELCSVGWLVDM